MTAITISPIDAHKPGLGALVDYVDFENIFQADFNALGK
jgi:hypothetical protein